MKRKTIILSLALALVAAVGLGIAVIFTSFAFVGGQALKKAAESYDLRGKNISVEDYEAIAERFPDKEIAWDVPFQEGTVEDTTKELTVSSLTEEDAQMLEFLPQLETLHAEGSTDYDLLMDLQSRRPDLQITYSVPMGSNICASEDEEITLKDTDMQQVSEGLPYLPNLKRIVLEGKLPALSDIQAAVEKYPEVLFAFETELGGKAFRTDDEELDFAQTEVTFEELQKTMPLLKAVKTIVLTDTGLSEEECRLLADENSETFFLFPLTIAGKEFSTDVELLDLNRKTVTVEEVEAVLPYFHNLKQVDMVNCGLDNETMDALNNRYENIRFVWGILINGVTYRTDIIYFYPWQQGIPHGGMKLDNLRYCPDLIAIDVGHYWVTDCSFLEFTPHVKYLILALTGCHDISPVRFLKELEYLEVFEMVVDDYSPILECTALKDLNIGCTYADPTPLFQMTWLDNLYWYRGEWQMKKYGFTVQELQDALPNTNVWFHLNRNGGQEWRYLPRYYIFRDIIGAGLLNQFAARLYWEEDMDAIRDSVYDKNQDTAEVIGQIIERRKAEGRYIPGIKNSGPKPKGTEDNPG